MRWMDGFRWDMSWKCHILEDEKGMTEMDRDIG